MKGVPGGVRASLGMPSTRKQVLCLYPQPAAPSARRINSVNGTQRSASGSLTARPFRGLVSPSRSLAAGPLWKGCGYWLPQFRTGYHMHPPISSRRCLRFSFCRGGAGSPISSRTSRWPGSQFGSLRMIVSLHDSLDLALWEPVQMHKVVLSQRIFYWVATV